MQKRGEATAANSIKGLMMGWRRAVAEWRRRRGDLRNMWLLKRLPNHGVLSVELGLCEFNQVLLLNVRYFNVRGDFCTITE